MNGKQTKIYEMLARVREFATNHVRAFAPETHAGRLVVRLDAAVMRLAVLSQDHAVGQGTLREASTHRARLRAALRSSVDTIARTARSLARDAPGTDARFRAPDPCRDQKLLDAAKHFLSE